MKRADWFDLAKHAGVLLLLAVLALMFGRQTAGAEDMPTVDVALVLAVDVSGSITQDEADLQRAGYAAAIMSPEVLKAIANGMHQRIAITYMEWSDEKTQRTIVPWTLVDGPLPAIAMAKTLLSSEPKSGLNTAIGNALTFAVGLHAIAPVKPDRRVIDVSGDGASNTGAPVQPARAAALAAGITINGLPICEIDKKTGDCGMSTADYYREFVIGGPGAFVVMSKGFGDFELAVKAKIASEIAGLTPRAQYAGHRVMQGAQPRDTNPKAWATAASITAVAFLASGESPAAPFLYAMFTAYLIVYFAAHEAKAR